MDAVPATAATVEDWRDILKNCREIERSARAEAVRCRDRGEVEPAAAEDAAAAAWAARGNQLAELIERTVASLALAGGDDA